MTTEFQATIQSSVKQALAEDIGTGDITAMLIEQDAHATASVITREPAIVCGIDWVNEVFRQLSDDLIIHWHVQDGQHVAENSTLFKITGPARPILTGERTALNFLQTLSGTATLCHHYAHQVAHTNVKILDTRKTIPGLRLAQKYAVRCGGCFNHRMGLFDAFLIKENHIMACGGIEKAINTARKISIDKPIEIEVENLEELKLALSAQADIIMLDNFSVDQLIEAVRLNNGQAKLEASGGINQTTLVAIAETGVDYISIGGLTKNCNSIDLSMRIDL